MHASKNHEFMVDCVLDQEEAPISHEVFKEGEEEAEEAGEGEEGLIDYSAAMVCFSFSNVRVICCSNWRLCTSFFNEDNLYPYLHTIGTHVAIL